MEKVFAYLRVSDISQVKGDGFSRQETACRDYAKLHNMEVAEIYKEDISGTKETQYRPVLASLIVSLEKNGHGIKTVIIEKLDRLARDLMVQEAIIRDFKKQRFNIISTMEGADLCGDDPTRKFIRQVMGAVAEYDKTMLVAKLRASRDRMRIREGHCEGRQGYKDNDKGLSIMRHIQALHRRPRYGKRRTLQQIADFLNEEGIKTMDGHEWSLFRVRDVLKKK